VIHTNATAAIVNVSRVIAPRLYHFVVAVWRAKEEESARVKYWEIIAGNLKKRAWSLGYVSALDANGETIWIVDAHRGDGQRFGVRADEKLRAFLELESTLRDARKPCWPINASRNVVIDENGN
jgi:hypothetical protein